MAKPNRFLANTDYGISKRTEHDTEVMQELLQNLLTEQQRTNQLIEWLGNLVAARTAS